MEVDEKSEDGEVPNSFVDGRNLLFLSFAAVFAKQKGIHHLKEKTFKMK